MYLLLLLLLSGINFVLAYRLPVIHSTMYSKVKSVLFDEIRKAEIAIAISDTSNVNYLNSCSLYHMFNESIIEFSNYTSFIPSGNDMCFVIEGEPQALSRHRHLLNSKIMYNPSAKLQNQFAKDSISHMPATPLSGPLEVSLLFYFTRPKIHYRTGKLSGVLKVTAPTFHSGAKDLDNLVKFVLDSLNAKAYLDDRQIVALHSYKFYTNLNPRVVVMIKSLPTIINT